MSWLEIEQGGDNPVPLLKSEMRLNGEAKHDFLTGSVRWLCKIKTKTLAITQPAGYSPVDEYRATWKADAKRW